jgi:hypothetical protein
MKTDRQYNGKIKTDRQYNGKMKTDRQYNGKMKKDEQCSITAFISDAVHPRMVVFPQQ